MATGTDADSIFQAVAAEHQHRLFGLLQLECRGNAFSSMLPIERCGLCIGNVTQVGQMFFRNNQAG